MKKTGRPEMARKLLSWGLVAGMSSLLAEVAANNPAVAEVNDDIAHCQNDCRILYRTKLEMIEELVDQRNVVPTARFCQKLEKFRKLGRKVLSPQLECGIFRIDDPETDLDLRLLDPEERKWEVLRLENRMKIIDALSLPEEFIVIGEVCQSVYNVGIVL